MCQRGGIGDQKIISCCLSILVVVIHLLLLQVSFTEELCKELLFVISCRENSKPVRKKASPSHTDSSSIYDFSNYGYSDKK
ncbi:hypothetical protein E2C01_049041 [Portunus trituberculatus]|uniref:Uncharacterized protein n=1 Tax=Portunus trituberculatus TaxID=210409 RepID=A0A5B7GCR7_PORTR|nr:hypothetical protein [Portunus trituberculatus]